MSPSGMVTFSLGGNTLGSAGVSPYQDPKTGASLAGLAIDLDASSLAAGTNVISATYTGDSNYAGSSGTVSVTYNPVPLSFAITSSGVTVTPGATTGNTSTITVTPGWQLHWGCELDCYPDYEPGSGG